MFEYDSTNWNSWWTKFNLIIRIPLFCDKDISIKCFMLLKYLNISNSKDLIRKDIEVFGKNKIVIHLYHNSGIFSDISIHKTNDIEIEVTIENIHTVKHIYKILHIKQEELLLYTHIECINNLYHDVGFDEDDDNE